MSKRARNISKQELRNTIIASFARTNRVSKGAVKALVNSILSTYDMEDNTHISKLEKPILIKWYIYIQGRCIGYAEFMSDTSPSEILSALKVAGYEDILIRRNLRTESVDKLVNISI